MKVKMIFLLLPFILNKYFKYAKEPHLGIACPDPHQKWSSWQMKTEWQRQAGTWDSLLQCLHLDKCLLLTFFDKAQRNDKELKITAHMLSWGKLWTTRYKRSKLNLYFWGARNKSRVLHMVPAQSTTKGVGRPPKLPSDLTHMLDPVLTPF